MGKADMRPGELNRIGSNLWPRDIYAIFSVSRHLNNLTGGDDSFACRKM